ncbi:MAG: hypothetical protein AABY64_13190 [Bdellovibrionota bacterium]
MKTLSALVILFTAASTSAKGVTPLNSNLNYSALRMLDGELLSSEIDPEIYCEPSPRESCVHAKKVTLKVKFNRGCANTLGPVLAAKGESFGDHTLIHIAAPLAISKQSQVALCAPDQMIEERELVVWVNTDTKNVSVRFMTN